jgi:hypothetical protein
MAVNTLEIPDASLGSIVRIVLSGVALLKSVAAVPSHDPGKK